MAEQSYKNYAAKHAAPHQAPQAPTDALTFTVTLEKRYIVIAAAAIMLVIIMLATMGSRTMPAQIAEANDEPQVAQLQAVSDIIVHEDWIDPYQRSDVTDNADAPAKSVLDATVEATTNESDLIGTWMGPHDTMTFSDAGTMAWTDDETNYYTWSINDAGYIYLSDNGETVLTVSTLRYDPEQKILVFSRATRTDTLKKI